MGANMFVTIDFSGMLTPEELSAVEAEANEWVWKNVPIEIAYPDAEALKTIPYRSKKELTGQVRIVTIPGADICACCGTHVSNTGEIGLIKIFSCVKFQTVCGWNFCAADVRSLTSVRSPSKTGACPVCCRQSRWRRPPLCSGFWMAEAAQKQRAAGLEEAVFAQKAQALGGRGMSCCLSRR